MLMRWLGGAAALLVLGLAVSARAADDGAAPSSGDHWWDRINPFAGKKADEAPKIPPTVPLPANAAAQSGARTNPPTLNPVTVKHENPEAACFRRNDVCDKLMQIALDTGNKELERQVELLQKRVDEVYRMQTAVRGAHFESDEAVLDAHLGSSRRDLTPAANTKTDGRTATLREERE